MNKRAALIHILICVIVGALISYFTAAKWIAASFWVSAALFINGSIAATEDQLPGGFENPQGDLPSTPAAESRFAITSIAITLALAAAGFLFQWYLP